MRTPNIGMKRYTSTVYIVNCWDIVDCIIRLRISLEYGGDVRFSYRFFIISIVTKM